MTSYKQGLNTEGEILRDLYVEHDSVDLDCEAIDDGMTRQEFRDECDINVLMATYERNGNISHLNKGTPQYLDVTDVPDLPKAIAMMNAAEEAFMTLPASVRREFDQDPVKFVEYAQDPENVEQMRKWGLAAPAKLPDEPIEVRVVGSQPPTDALPEAP